MFSCVMVVILYGIYKSIIRSKYLDNDYAFTIGQTIKYDFADGNKDCIEYKYFVNNRKFISCVTIDPKICCPLNKFYKVKYSKIKPEICEMYLSKEIKDSAEIIEAGFEYEKK